jgi:hypothetical protein
MGKYRRALKAMASALDNGVDGGADA